MSRTSILAALVVLAVVAAGVAIFYYMKLDSTESSTAASNRAGLPFCHFADDRIPVPTWSVELDKLGNLTSEPPQNDGQVVYIELFAENDEVDCASADSDKLFSFSLPNNPNAPLLEGGLAVNLRGNVQFANGFCYFKGFFMNQQVMGMHQGWIETYFGAVDQFDVIKSDRFCAER
jgi:hypothetical protein